MSIHQEPVFEPSILARSLWSFLSPWNFGSSFCGSKQRKNMDKNNALYSLPLPPPAKHGLCSTGSTGKLYDSESSQILRFSCHHLSYPRFSASLWLKKQSIYVLHKGTCSNCSFYLAVSIRNSGVGPVLSVPSITNFANYLDTLSNWMKTPLNVPGVQECNLSRFTLNILKYNLRQRKATGWITLW